MICQIYVRYKRLSLNPVVGTIDNESLLNKGFFVDSFIKFLYTSNLMITISVGITLVIENDTIKCILERSDLFMY